MSDLLMMLQADREQLEKERDEARTAVERLKEDLRLEQEAHAALQVRCFDNGLPTGVSIFDLERRARAERDALAALVGEMRGAPTASRVGNDRRG